MNNSHKYFKNIQSDFIGLDTLYTRADGKKTKRIYLDSTASTLMMKAAYNAVESFYDHYANTHSLLHFSAKTATQNYQWAHERILSFVKADTEKYACFFTGSGTTAGTLEASDHQVSLALIPDLKVPADHCLLGNIT